MAISVAVHLSPRCLLDAELVRRVTGVLAEFGCGPRCCAWRSPESAVMANPAHATATVSELHDLGRSVADWVGTGP
ncbi:hypothetical protein AB0H83_37575 [Dactylosporangium sp. NPDC050688]|uniref:hypothetical protein n=1 Tax=Dactylosporangium sp. NPDC050688 TaxID=3157217 RepID=UPI0033FF7510